MQPNSPYSASKAAADHLARAWHHTYGLPVIVTNCSNNYGPYQFPEKLIPLMIINALAGQATCRSMAGARTGATGCMSRITCAASAWRSTAGKPGGKYNFGGGAERTQSRGGAHDLRHSRSLRPDGAGTHERLIRFVTDRPGHDLRYAIDAGHAQRELGWRAARDLRERARDDRALVSRECAIGGERAMQGRYDGERLGLGRLEPADERASW